MAVNYPGVRFTNSLPAGSNNIGDVDVLSMPNIISTPLQLLWTGRPYVTTPGTRVRCYGGGATKQLIMKADEDNAGKVYLGNIAVTSANGLVLEPGAGIAVYMDDNAYGVYIDADTALDSISMWVLG